MNQASNIARVAKLDCATLSDAMDRLRIAGQCSSISPRGEGFQLSGRAFTVRYAPAETPPGTVGDYIDDVPAGSIVVLDNGGRLDVTVWGDILTEIAQRKGISGTVIDGICRDVALCRRIGYPIFSRDNWMRTGKDRVQVDAIEVPVSVGNVRVLPGDLLRGDADGVVVLPAIHENAILDAAEGIERSEDAIRDLVRQGMRLDEARRLHGYHRLQTSRE
jgi:regulator of RNase E activity RraA